MTATTTTRAVPTRRPPSRPRNWPSDRVGDTRRHTVRHHTPQPRPATAPPARAVHHAVRMVNRGVRLTGLDRARLALVAILGCALLAAATAPAPSPTGTEAGSVPTPPAAPAAAPDAPQREIAGAGAGLLRERRQLADPLAALHLPWAAHPMDADAADPRAQGGTSQAAVVPVSEPPVRSAAPRRAA